MELISKEKMLFYYLSKVLTGKNLSPVGDEYVIEKNHPSIIILNKNKYDVKKIEIEFDASRERGKFEKKEINEQIIAKEDNTEFITELGKSNYSFLEYDNSHYLISNNKRLTMEIQKFSEDNTLICITTVNPFIIPFIFVLKLSKDSILKMDINDLLFSLLYADWADEEEIRSNIIFNSSEEGKIRQKVSNTLYPANLTKLFNSSYFIYSNESFSYQNNNGIIKTKYFNKLFKISAVYKHKVFDESNLWSTSDSLIIKKKGKLIRSFAYFNNFNRELKLDNYIYRSYYKDNLDDLEIFFDSSKSHCSRELSEEDLNKYLLNIKPKFNNIISQNYTAYGIELYMKDSSYVSLNIDPDSGSILILDKKNGLPLYFEKTVGTTLSVVEFYNKCDKIRINSSNIDQTMTSLLVDYKSKNYLITKESDFLINFVLGNNKFYRNNYGCIMPII